MYLCNSSVGQKISPDFPSADNTHTQICIYITFCIFDVKLNFFWFVDFYNICK